VRRRGLPPVIDAHVEVLILGSFPSPASLAKKQYYGHPQNHFWKLMGALLDEPLYQMEYASRLKIMLKRHIGLWDVLHQCERAGALDSNIRCAVSNDFRKVMKIAPSLRRVCFNGKTAGRFEPVFAECGYETLVLPSSSPAYTLPFAEKLRRWRGVDEPRAQCDRASDNCSSVADASNSVNFGAAGENDANDANDANDVNDVNESGGAQRGLAPGDKGEHPDKRLRVPGRQRRAILN
jgi:double-stranded uracil-DNA glycosylase